MVEFQVATDRRDALRRATNISLLDESFAISGEKRERGAIAALKVRYLDWRKRSRKGQKEKKKGEEEKERGRIRRKRRIG